MPIRYAFYNNTRHNIMWPQTEQAEEDQSELNDSLYLPFSLRNRVKNS